MHRVPSLVAAALALALACTPPETEVPPIPAADRGCDPLVPSYCAFPFPNDWWTVPDDRRPTGRRLHLNPALMPENVNGVRSETDAFNMADGFSPSIPAIAHLPGATETGLPTPGDLDASLAVDSPTVILAAETGERLAHFVDLDAYVLEGHRQGRFEIDRDPARLEAERALLIRPAVRPEDGTRYIVAIRGVVDARGVALEPSPAFRALRDGEITEDPVIESRRRHFEEIFERLEAAGVSRDDLQLAWDFTTASKENNTGWMVHARDDALTSYPGGVPYTVHPQTVSESHAHNTACRLEIAFQMPLYLESDQTGAWLNVGTDNVPEQTGTGTYRATLIVPRRAIDTPAPLVQYGHGQLGSREEVLAYQAAANRNNMAMFALDWVGFAFWDNFVILDVLESGEISRFRSVPEGLHQAFLNFLMSMRTLSVAAEGGPDTPLNEALATHCEGARIDGNRRHYLGASQGGILGASVMALTTDVERGVLAVPGQPYHLLLQRSVNFDRFTEIVYPRYAWNALDMQMVLALVQSLWDRADPSGYSRYIRSDTLPNTPSHEVLLQVSVGDHQVTDLGAHLMARAIGGVVSLGPAHRPIWGIEEVTGEHHGSGILEIFFGNTEIPSGNVPPWDDPARDPHSRGWEVDELFDLVDRFFEEGVLENPCDGVCGRP